MKTKVVNQNDPRVKKTKQQFMKAFKELMLAHDDYMNISVKELCDKAGLNRKTFYLHFKQVDELFSQLQSDSIEEFYVAIKGLDIFKDVEAVVKAYFDLNESNDVYRKLCLSPHYTYTKEISLKKAVSVYEQRDVLSKDIHSNSYIRDYVSAFYYFTGFIMYGKWVRSNRAIPKEEAIKITASLIKNGITVTRDM